MLFRSVSQSRYMLLFVVGYYPALLPTAGYYLIAHLSFEATVCGDSLFPLISGVTNRFINMDVALWWRQIAMP